MRPGLYIENAVVEILFYFKLMNATLEKYFVIFQYTDRLAYICTNDGCICHIETVSNRRENSTKRGEAHRHRSVTISPPAFDCFVLCFTSLQQRGHLETALPFTVPCEGREAR